MEINGSLAPPVTGIALHVKEMPLSNVHKFLMQMYLYLDLFY